MDARNRSFVATIITFLFLTLGIEKSPAHATKPNIVVIIADDMGRNDIGFHGSNQIPTPNLDAMAYNGIILDRFYTQSICTPSRAAFLTGNYPIRSGMQGYPLKAGENRSLPMDMPIIPQHLKKLGYKTHLVGKWHLGAAYRDSTPTRRGFDTHFGYWNGFVGYFDYLSFQKLPNTTRIKGFDLHDQFEPVWSAQGKYATELFTQKAVEIIDRHDSGAPLFLVLSHLAPHVGKDGVELEVPNATLADAKYSYIKDRRRRLYADIVNKMDDSVGQVLTKLWERHMLENSIILFFSDNGAQTIGMYENSGSNWPLRGVKFSEFEGGIRTAAAIFSPLFKQKGYVNKELIHLVDWLPTFYAAAGGNLSSLGKIDGLNQWEVLSKNLQSNRTEVLVNINEVGNTSAIIMDKGRYKLLYGTFDFGRYDKYYGESGRGVEVPQYDPQTIINSTLNQIMQKTMNTSLTVDKIAVLRYRTDLSWCRANETEATDCITGCLFDLESDPCETTNIIVQNPEVAQKLSRRLAEFAKKLVPQSNQVIDCNSDPLYYNNTWCPWLDDELCFKTPNNNHRIS